MTLSPLDRTEARGELRLDVSNGRVLLDLDGRLAAGANPFRAAFAFPLSGQPFTGTVTGSLSDLDLVMPWDGAKGKLDFTADIADAEPAARISIALGGAGPVMPLPGFAYALTDFTMTGKFADDRLTFSAITGKLGGGPVRISGDIGLGEAGIAAMDLRLEGRDMVLSPMARLRIQADASLRLLKDDKRFVTDGEILFKRMDWRREIYEEFSFSTPTDEPEAEGPSFFDGMTLNIRLRADDNAVIDNSLGRFNGRFNLTATGAFSSPVLLGDLDLGSGDFYFQDRGFRVIFGRLSFTDPVNTEPYLDFRGETYVKDYRVTLNMSGPVSRLKPEFSSSPPLPPEEILSLLALGESFRRMYYAYAGDRSTALNTASLLTYQIADLAKKTDGRPLLARPLPDRSLHPGERAGRHRRADHRGQEGLEERPVHLFDDPGQLHRHGRDRRGPHLPHGMGHQQEVLARGRAGRQGEAWPRCQVPQAFLDLSGRPAGPGWPRSWPFS
ncbi:MAG: translocation/assembly module TamB [Desulfomicrobium escambiense]|nr:translocation/assembly module TamB [Desulfomicrobium escambiense]